MSVVDEIKKKVQQDLANQVVVQLANSVERVLVGTNYPDTELSAIALISLGVTRLSDCVGHEQAANFVEQYVPNIRNGVRWDDKK